MFFLAQFKTWDWKHICHAVMLKFLPRGNGPTPQGARSFCSSNNIIEPSDMLATQHLTTGVYISFTVHQTDGIQFDGLKILGSILQGTLHDLSFVSFLFSISVYFYVKLVEKAGVCRNCLRQRRWVALLVLLVVIDLIGAVTLFGHGHHQATLAEKMDIYGWELHKS